MSRWGKNYRPTEIENPEAYAAAIKRNIYARATAKRQREWDEANPTLAAWLNWSGVQEHAAPDFEGEPQTRYTYDAHPAGPVPSFARDAREKWGSLTEKGTATLQRIYDERMQRNTERAEQRAAEALTAVAWTPGRQQVEGVILSTKVVENDFGSAIKMLVKRDDGSKIWSTMPASIDIASSGNRGLRIRFTVTVQPKDGEPTFAFGSRPTKGEVLS